MNTPQTSPAAQRLQRLAAFLDQDPANPALLADACDTAIACGAHEQALAYIESADRLALDSSEWGFRRARLAIARGDLAQAAQLLQGLLEHSGPHPVLAHDLAYVRLLQGDAAGCNELLQPWMDAPAQAGLPPQQQQALQMLWLRSAHHQQLSGEALAWAREQDKAGLLQPAARGVASLIALDEDELDTARAWAESGLQADGAQLEALLARGSLALAEGNAAGAVRWLEQALARHPDDGRTWATLGLANLQAMNLPAAQAQLERGVAAMPGHIDSWHALAWARLLQGDRDGALAALRRALELDASDAQTHGALALVLALAGDKAGAATHAETAQQLDPENATASYARALLSGQGRDPQAVEALQRSLLGQGGELGARLQDILQPGRRGKK